MDKVEKELNKKIIEVTNNIRQNYPELLKYLNEMPETIPSEDDPSVEHKDLSDYYKSLVDLVKEYDENKNK